MKTGIVLRGHIDSKGRLHADEVVPLPPGDVELMVVPARLNVEVPDGSQKARVRKMRSLRKRAHAMKCPAVPRDGKTIDELLYGNP